MIKLDLYQIIGFFGMIFVVVAYLFLQMNKLKNDDYAFLYMNLIGSILLIISLFKHLNLGSMIIEIFWLIITIYGFKQRLNKDKIQK